MNLTICGSIHYFVQDGIYLVGLRSGSTINLDRVKSLVFVKEWDIFLNLFLVVETKVII